MEDPRPSPSKYRPDVDGLRAIAVLGVILFHFGFGFPGGYVGVDVFFVISGFLITRIIRDDLENRSFTFSGFWARRVRRILPASFVMSLVVLGVGCLVLLPSDMRELGEATFAHGVFASNFYHWQQLRDYFGNEARLRPLLHGWSLGVEEQFYILFPFLLFWLRGLGSRSHMSILGTIALTSLLLCGLGAFWFPNASFFFLPTRIWELLTGSVIAVRGMPLCLGPVRKQLLGLVGLGCILVAMLFYTEQTVFPGFAALLPVLGTALVIIANEGGGTWTYQILSLRPLVFVGLASYSLYLWHWPLLVFARYLVGDSLPLPVLGVMLTLTALLSVPCWRFIEVPFRRAGSFQSPVKVVAVGLAAAVAVCLLSLALVFSGGWPGRYAGDKLATEDAAFGNASYFRGDAEAVPADLPLIGCAGTNCLPGRVLLWGDSHATPLVEAVDGALRLAGLRGMVAARIASAPIIESRDAGSEPSRWNNAVLAYLETGDVSTVIIASRWSNWLRNEATFAVVAERLDRLTRMGIKVYLLQQVPEQPFHVSRVLHVSRFGGLVPSGVPLSEHRNRQETVSSYLTRLQSSGVRVLDPAPYCFDESGFSIIGEKDRSYYRDDNHLSSYGAVKLLGALFLDVAAEISRSQ